MIGSLQGVKRCEKAEGLQLASAVGLIYSLAIAHASPGLSSLLSLSLPKFLYMAFWHKSTYNDAQVEEEEGERRGNVSEFGGKGERTFVF